MMLEWFDGIFRCCSQFRQTFACSVHIYLDKHSGPQTPNNLHISLLAKYIKYQCIHQMTYFPPWWSKHLMIEAFYCIHKNWSIWWLKNLKIEASNYWCIWWLKKNCVWWFKWKSDDRKITMFLSVKPLFKQIWGYFAI